MPLITPIDHLYIRECVCNSFGFTWAEIKSVSRERELVDTRHAYVYLCAMFTKRRPFNIMVDVNRHRSSFYKSVASTQDKIDTLDCHVYPQLKRIIDQINKHNATQPTKEEIKA